MKIKNFQKNNIDVKIPNFIKSFENHGIYIGGCNEIFRKYKQEIKDLCRRSIVHHYLSGKSAIPVDLVIKISETNPGILKECYLKSGIFASRANKGHKLPKKVTPELTYLLGCLRDGHLDNTRYGLSISQRADGKEWLILLSDIINKEFGIKPKIRKFGDCFELRVNSKPLVLYLNIIFGMTNNQENWNVPEIIKANESLWKYFVSGFFDAEGYCTKPETFRKTGKKKISFHQNNLDCLKFIKRVLERNNIKTSEIFLQKDRKCYALYVQSETGVKRFSITFNPIRKADKLNELLKCFVA